MFFIHSTPEMLKKQQSAVVLDLSLGHWNHMTSVTSLFSKNSIFSIFPSTIKRKAPFANSSDFKSVFGRQFLRISLDGRPKWRNKAPFSNFCGMVQIGPKKKSRSGFEERFRKTAFEIALPRWLNLKVQTSSYLKGTSPCSHKIHQTRSYIEIIGENILFNCNCCF